MRIDVVTVFPDYLAALDLSLIGKARQAGLLDLRVHDLRDWTTDRHRTVDDTPFGGGAGMVMRPDVWGRCLDTVLDGAGLDDAVLDDAVLDGKALDDAVLDGAGLDATALDATVLDGAVLDGAVRDGAVRDGDPGAHLVIPTPSGEVFTQRHAEKLAGERQLVIACGRYEGIDARVAEHYRAAGHRVSELSIGDYVLNGGEVAALVMIEAVGRLLPGVVGNPESLVEESHGAAGLLEYPVYTKPPVWDGAEIPEVLLSGHHAKIARWRRDRALERTAARRPDMIAALDVAALDKHDRALLAALGWQVTNGTLRRVPAEESAGTQGAESP